MSDVRRQQATDQTGKGVAADHEVIYLQPWCERCERQCPGEGGGRQWCEDDVWDPCGECGRKSVAYRLEGKQ